MTPAAVTDDERAFLDWMRRVDAHIAARVGGLTSEDLPDWTYRDAFEDGLTPREAALEAIEAAGG